MKMGGLLTPVENFCHRCGQIFHSRRKYDQCPECTHDLAAIRRYNKKHDGKSEQRGKMRRNAHRCKCDFCKKYFQGFNSTSRTCPDPDCQYEYTLRANRESARRKRAANRVQTQAEIDNLSRPWSSGCIMNLREDIIKGIDTGKIAASINRPENEVQKMIGRIENEGYDKVYNEFLQIEIRDKDGYKYSTRDFVLYCGKKSKIMYHRPGKMHKLTGVPVYVHESEIERISQ